jgi:hypothetical protein
LPKFQSPEVFRDRPSSKGIGGVRSITLGVHRSGGGEIAEEPKYILVVDRQGVTHQ